MKQNRLCLSLFVVFFVTSWFIHASSLYAQTMTGAWVNETNKKIDAARKADVRIIVLGPDGKPVPRAAVRIEQVSHDFTLGLVVGDAGLPAFDPGSPVLRCFNAVSLEHFTDWSTLQPAVGEPDFARVDELVDAARHAGLTVRWGPVLSADAARNPEWVVALDDAALAETLQRYVETIVARYARRVDAYDLYSYSLDHSFIEDRLGVPMVRRLHHAARAAAPGAAVALPLENCLAEARLNRATQRAEVLRQQFVPFDQVAMPQRIAGLLLQRQLAHGLELLGTLGAPVVVGPLEVGGSSEAGAGDNLETLLRILFATEAVEGIYLAGLTAADVADPTAALVDDAGAPLKPGAVLDGLFRGTWWTDETQTADDLGNVYARVFTGTHRITATIAGREVSMTVRISKAPPAGLPQHIVLMEP